MRDIVAQWLAESQLREFATYLLSTVPGLPPISQSIHILGIATVVGTAGMVNLKLLGLALPNQNVSEMIRRLLPWTFIAVAVNLVTGLLFVLARPIRYFYNPIATAKFAFLIPAVALAFAIYWMNRRQHGYWEASAGRLRGARIIAAVSLVCWIGVMLGGRWIAYSEYITDPFPFPFDWEALAGYTSFWIWLQDHPISAHIGYTWWFPLLESIHVIAIALVVGSIATVDLRLLGLAAVRYPVSQVVRKLVPWTWAAFNRGGHHRPRDVRVARVRLRHQPGVPDQAHAAAAGVHQHGVLPVQDVPRRRGLGYYGAVAAGRAPGRSRIAAALGRRRVRRPLDRPHHLNRLAPPYSAPGMSARRDGG